ncbi:MAG TPA: DUF3344 domain-containing protein [Methanomicrobiales archaeon]|nr:DUF3344 domain-containing protein [Methanomicrobiales archaeon]
MIGTRSSCWFPAAILALALLTTLPVLVTADEYVGGVPLATVQSGTVTGDLWFDITPAPDWGRQDVVKTFTLPAAAVAEPGRIKWARLYISAYCGHMQNDYDFWITNRWDGDGDGTYEQVWPEPAHAGFNFFTNGGNDNRAFDGHGDGEPYKMINDHETRVTSDYLMYYDVRDLIKGQTIRVNVDTSGTFDGRIKVISLVVAYDDPASTTETRYWVNQGHDVCSYYTENTFGYVAVGSTTFGTGDIPDITSAVLTIDYMASNNGFYGFPTDSSEFDPDAKAGNFNFPLDRVPDVQGPYSGVDSWDVTSQVRSSGNRDVTLGYARYLPATGTSAFYKLPLAFLVVKRPIPAAVPVAGFTADVVSGVAPLTVHFTDQSTNSPTSWSWDFNDDGSVDSTAQNPTYTYATAGTYAVKLTAANSGGSDTEVRTNYIVVSAPPVAPSAAFSANVTSGTAPLAVRFADLSTGNPTGWAWDFDGDGTIDSTRQNPIYTYSAAGTYTVNLTVTGPGGNDSEIRKRYIQVSERSETPVAGFTANATSGQIPFTVQYTDQSTGTVTSYAWDFDDDGTVDSAAKDPAFTYYSPGIYSVNLTVTGPGGSDSDMKTGFITATPGPVAAFTANTTSGTAPLTVRFTDLSTGNPTGWAWDFDDDGTIDCTEHNPTYTYTIAGTYTVNLSVTGSGVSDSEIKNGYVVVALPSGAPPAAPVAAFTANSTSGSIPFSVQFTDLSTGGVTSYAWDFDDDGTVDSAAKDPAFTYSSPGIYSVNLTVTGPGGSDSDMKTGFITATPGPVAAFTANITSGTAPLTVLFTDLSTGNPWYWKWTYGDGSTSTSRNPAHTYNNAGIYTVNLVVSADKVKWSDPAGQVITVNSTSGIPGVSFAASPTSGVAPLTVQFTDSSSGSPTSWAWDFDDDDSTDSTEQNPSHTFTSVGSYTVRLTATNTAGSDSLTRSNYIAVTTSSGSPDLTIETIVPNLGSVSAMNVFALEKNPVTIKIQNGANTSSAATTVQLVSSDGFSGTAPVPAIGAYAETTVVVTDTTERPAEGGTVTYTATVDPGNTVQESNENNNARTGPAITVRYNGYKGKRYWPRDGDITTKHTFDLNGSLIYSRGDSEYRSGSFGDGGWLSYTVRWTGDDLQIPANATVRAAYLYVPYTWDNENIAPDHTFVNFNGVRFSRSSWYWDQSNFGSYANYKYGLLTYDVTSEYLKNGDNSAVFTRENPRYSDPAEAAVYTKLSMYEFFLVVVYEDEEETEKQIFMNDGFDLLGASAAYGTTPAESTAYIPFTGMTIDTARMRSATLVTFVPSGDSNEGNILYNGNVVAGNVWSWGGTGTGADGGHQVAVDTRDVTSYIAPTENTFAIQSTDLGDVNTPCMAAIQQFLIINFGSTTTTTTAVTAAPTAAATAAPTIAQTEVPTGITTPVASPSAATTIQDASAQGALAVSPGESQPGSAGKASPSSGGGTQESSRGSPLETVPPLAYTGISLAGTGLAVAFRKGWLSLPLIPIGKAVVRDDPFFNFTSRIGFAVPVPASTSVPITMQDECPGPMSWEPASPNRTRWHSLVIGLVLAGAMVAGAAWTLGLLPFHSSAVPGPSSSPGASGGGTFNLIPTVESIEDLDMANHVPDYPPGFSARNGLLFVYQGRDRYRVSDLEIDLTSGSNRVTLDSQTVPPSPSVINPSSSSYFEEMGNGDGVLDPGEWLMVYADGCYDSSQAADEPRGKVLTWKPRGSGSQVEVPEKAILGYSLKNTADGSVLQQGTLSFAPETT